VTGAGQGRGGPARRRPARSGGLDGHGGSRDRSRERGADRYERAGAADPLDPTAWSAGASLEELPSTPLPVAPRSGPPLGVGGTLAVLAMAALLAAGLGFLGGRASPSPSPPAGAVAPSRPGPSGDAPTPGIGIAPQITPFSPCAAAPTSPPQLQLQVNGVPNPGIVEVFPPDTRSPGRTASGDANGSVQRVTIPADVITEVWIVGGACALGWNIGLIGNPVLNAFVTPRLDPAIAAQNRFALTLAPFAGRDLNLRADLFFPAMMARAIWPITVLPVERPTAALHIGGDAWSPVEGCDVVLALGNGYEYPTDPACLGDLPTEPDIVLEIERDDELELRLGDWDIQSAVLTCGRLSGTSFVAEPAPGCFLEASTRRDPSTFARFPALPAEISGAWTIQLSACALSGGLAATNRLCGSWYANVEIRPGR
jgi:hypothetical protein